MDTIFHSCFGRYRSCRRSENHHITGLRTNHTGPEAQWLRPRKSWDFDGFSQVFSTWSYWQLDQFWWLVWEVTDCFIVLTGFLLKQTQTCPHDTCAQMTPVPIATTPMLGAAYCAQPTWEAGWVLLPKLVSEYSDVAESQWSILATNIGAEVPSGLVSTNHTFNRTINRTIVILHPNMPRRGWMHLTPIGLGPQLRFHGFWHDTSPVGLPEVLQPGVEFRVEPSHHRTDLRPALSFFHRGWLNKLGNPRTSHGGFDCWENHRTRGYKLLCVITRGYNLSNSWMKCATFDHVFKTMFMDKIDEPVDMSNEVTHT